MNNLTHVSFLEYSKERGIIENSLNEEFKINKSIKEESILYYLKIISEFHEKIMGYQDYICYRLQDKRGRAIEQYKIYLKKAARELNIIKEKRNLNSFEKLSLEYGEEYLKTAEKCIEGIYNKGYLEILKRSMNRCEIVLGEGNLNSISKRDFIEVASLETCAYDLVELDAVYYINKLIKKEVNIDYEGLIKQFCRLESLDENSFGFMKAMVSFPYEFIRCFIKGIDKYTEKDGEKYLNKLSKAIELSKINLM